MQITTDLEALAKSLQSFGKENLAEILHFIAKGLRESFKCKMVRIYLEDLYEGMLVCHYVTGQDRPNQHHITKYISPKESIISQAFYENKVTVSWDLPHGLESFANPFEKLFGIKASVVYPITYQLRPIGTLSMDWEEEGRFLNQDQIDTIASFLSDHSATIEKAKKFHQNVSFSKHLDLARKKEAAWTMVRSAVKLIEKLTLASVLVPVSNYNPEAQKKDSSDLVEILAAYSKHREDADIYNNKDQISVLSGENLINRIIHFDKDDGLQINDTNQSSIYIDNILDKQFSRKPIASKINLVSLYQVPKYDKSTGKFICAVNYYTSEHHKFTTFEESLLQEHASMIEKLLLEESITHIEIQVLSEIEELLSEQDHSLAIFLHKILGKTSELLGADCGTISLLNNIDNQPWLVVEEKDGKLIGAKSRGWKKSQIPKLPVGGKELPIDLKSLNGYCAHLARPLLVNNVHDSRITEGFYKNLSPAIRSELAVPIIFGNNVLGVINQDSFKTNHFTEEHKKILQIIASLISQKINSLKQVEDVRQKMVNLRQDIGYRDPKVSSYYLGNVIGRSGRIHSLVNQINTVVDSISKRMLHWDSNNQGEALMGLPSILITGDTGSGKEFFFNNIYSRISEIFQKAKHSNFKLPLRKTNIAAYSGDLTYSEMFGHTKGAFTGADSTRQGILEEADGGVVFLDEIGDADPKTQVQLLRFLDTGVFMRLGESQPRYSRIFLVAATNKNLIKEIEAGRFREDLYHRLSALSFHIPPLDQRREDIEDLAIHFLGRLYQAYGDGTKNDSPPKLDNSAIEALKNHSYRGNVRELKNILLRAILFNNNPVITGNDITNARQTDWTEKEPAQKKPESEITIILNRLEKQEGNFWSEIYRPFKDKQITRGTVKSILDSAKTRFQTNLPGLAVKMGVCSEQFRIDPQENKKFVSFKNFLYKTIKVSQN